MAGGGVALIGLTLLMAERLTRLVDS
ncbi:hypothetical protein [Coprococcus comes]